MKRIEVSSKILEDILMTGTIHPVIAITKGIEEDDVLVNVTFNEYTRVTTLWFDTKKLPEVTFLEVKQVYD